MPRFDGTPVEQAGAPRFSGTPVEQPARDPEADWGPVPTLLPAQRNQRTGEWRWTAPQVVRDVFGAAEAPQKALAGEYGLEVDEDTGRPTTMTNEMIGDALAGAGVAGTGSLVPAAAGIRQTGQSVLTGAPRRVVTRALAADNIPMSEVSQRLIELGPDAVLADLGPNLQAKAAAIATSPGRGARTVTDTLAARKAGTNQRIIGEVNDTLGQSPIPSEMQAVIRQGQDNLSPEYRRVFAENATRVDSTPIAEELDSMAVNLRGPAQTAAQRVRKMLDVVTSPEDRRAGQAALDAEWRAGGSQGARPTYEPPLDPNPGTLFEVRQAIDGALEVEKDPKVVGVMKYIRGQVDRMLAEAVPGIKDVDARYEQLALQNEALGRGQQVLDSGRTAPRPQEVASMMTEGALPNGTLIGPSGVPLRLSQGARAEIDRIIGTTSNDLNALRTALKGDGSWNRDRLVELFGENRTKRLLQIFERELKYDQTQNLALQGSRTEVLRSAKEDINGKGPRPNPFRSAANFQFGDAAADSADRLLGWAGNLRRASVNHTIADALMSRGGTDYVNTLADFQPNMAQQNAPLAYLRMLAIQQGD